MFSDLRRDMAYATRMLMKNPGFTAVAVLTLALGIGANTTVFSVVEALLNFPLPMDDPNRIALIFSENPAVDLTQSPASVDDFLDWRRQSRSFEFMAAGAAGAYNLVGSGEPVRVTAFRFSAGFFPMTGKSLAMGRPFLEEENQPGAPRVVVLSHGFWQKRFGGNPNVLGEQLSLDGEAYTVVGVAAEDFFFPLGGSDLFTPLVLEPGRSNRDERTLLVMGRLRPGVSADEATAEMQTIARRIEKDHPDTNEGWAVNVQTVRDNLSSGSALAMILLYGAITFVLLIACANVANLLLARATAREKEIALRTTLGAGRLRLIRQLMTEAVMLSSVGGALGFLLALWGINVLRNMVAPDPNVGFIADVMQLNSNIVFHTLGISVLSGLLFGLAPALQTSKPKLYDTLKEAGRGAGGGRRRRYVRNLLVMSQVAMALALLGTAGALIRAFNHIYTADPGFNPADLLTMQIALPERDYSQPRQVAAFYRETLDRMARIPGVESAALTTTLPLTLFPGGSTTPVTVEGATDEESAKPTVVELVVSPSYFETMEIPVIQGRGLTTQDSESSLRVAVVSKEMVHRHWMETDLIGRRFKLDGAGSDNPWITVVGVTDDVQTHGHSLRNPTLKMPHVFLPHAQSPRRTTFVVLRTAVEPLSIAAAAREAVWEIDKSQPVEDIQTMADVIARVDTQNTFFVRILTGLAVIALVLAGVGIYGVISYSVQQRSHEIGIRMALGAQPRSIVYLVVKQGALLTGIGLLFGVAGAVTFVRLMGSQLEGLQEANASGPLTFVTVSLVLLAVAKLASYIPARRAVRVDPVVTLRYE